MNYKKILVIGAGGFVGKHLVRYLTEHGYSVRAMVRSNSDPSFLKTMNVEIAEADLRIKDTIRPALEGVDCVIHLAAT